MIQKLALHFVIMFIGSSIVLPPSEALKFATLTTCLVPSIAKLYSKLGY